MPKFKVMATSYDYYDAYVEAKDAQEAYEKAKYGVVEWVQVNDIGEWEVHGDCVYEIEEYTHVDT